tara:strand:- start:313 stop:669 length:357 start_codon:yes stop_codon:yes gene_type:complete
MYLVPFIASLADSDPSEWIMIQEEKEKEKHRGDMLRWVEMIHYNACILLWTIFHGFDQTVSIIYKVSRSIQNIAALFRSLGILIGPQLITRAASRTKKAACVRRSLNTIPTFISRHTV